MTDPIRTGPLRIRGTCGICRRDLAEEPLKTCPGCQALYHPDCWTYNQNRCAVYGCLAAHGEFRSPLVRAIARRGTPTAAHVFGAIGGLIGLVPAMMLVGAFFQEGLSLFDRNFFRLLHLVGAFAPVFWILAYLPRARRRQETLLWVAWSLTAVWGYIGGSFILEHD